MSILDNVTDRKLRVSILALNYAPESTGIAPYVTRLAERLAAEGHAVETLVGFPHYPEWQVRAGYSGWQSSETVKDVQVKRLRHYVPSNPTALRRLHLELSFGLRLLFARWSKPDVVLVVTPALFSSALVLLRTRFGLRRPATGIWVQDIYSRGLDEISKGPSMLVSAMRHFEGFVLRSATGVCVIHERFKDYVVSGLGVDHKNVAVIRNWAHLDTQPSSLRSSTRLKWGWQDQDIVVLHAGNMGAKQGLTNVVNAAALATQRDSPVHFVLLGDGNQRQQVKALAAGVGHIQFIDPVPDEDFSAVLHAADVLLVNELPGLRETAVPSKLTSYFSTGRPVIAATDSDSTTAGEIARSGGGIRVEPNAPEALVKAAERLGADNDLSGTLGRAGQNYAGKTLSEDAAIVAYGAWLQTLQASKSGASSADTA
ncbi:glycosyltransferase family 4 protein [Arthrobacter agilis]|uniref:glycosyltransferase family 4 protein n=1 Tax=Arthrobacter agilis TaxID=37921 RepID=UPI002782D9E1|nr:glycosyltransferase family 4 protein [Arthrobacter agilis]MDQ0734045.1 colanic acid biosynthesis glycosyl transferase WcaI [Arthrobacter agilis]